MSVPFKVKALHEYSSEYEDDLQFPAGLIITVTDIEDDDWYSGTLDGKAGLFPKNFVELIKEDDLFASSKKPVPSSITTGVASVLPVPTSDPVSQTFVAKTEEVTDVKKEHVSESLVPNLQDSTEALAEMKEPEVTAHDLEIDDLIRKNSTALPEQFDEEASVFGGNMKHVERPASPPQPPVPVPAVASPKQTKEEPVSPKKSEAPVPHVPHVPMPGSLSLHKDDPYAIKKQFIGAGKSSYVPQVKPRDTSSVVHGFNDVSETSQIAKETDETPQEESNEPKMSLKERIAMLQKRQQEEAEREAAARKKKEERKKKLEEEKRAKAAQAASAPPSVPASSLPEDEIDPELSEEPSAGHSLAGQPKSLHLQISGAQSLLSQDHLHSKVTTAEDDVAEEDSETETAEIENLLDQEEDGDENGAEEQQQEEEQEEEDDEDLKRRRLVERMAKISGGRNMFGMMGMPNPFGSAPAPAASEAPKAKKKLKDSESSRAPAVPEISHGAEPTPVEKVSKVGIPIPGIGIDHPLQPTLGNEELTKAESKEQPFVGDEEDEPSEDTDAHHDKAEMVQALPEKEIAEKREQSIAPETLVQTQDRAPLAPPDSLRPEAKNSVEKQSMSIVKENAPDVLGTDYEADADVSDIGVSHLQENGRSEELSRELMDSKAPDSLPSVPTKPVVAPPPPLEESTIDFASAPTIPGPPPKVPSTSLDATLESSHPPLPDEDAPMSPSVKDPLAELPPSQAPPVPSQTTLPTTAGDVLKRDMPEPPVQRPPPPVPPVPPVVPSVGASHENVAHHKMKAPPPPPPVPTNPPISHVPQSNFVDVPEEEDEDSSDDEIQVVDAQPVVNMERSQTYSAGGNVQPSQYMPPSPIRKSNTGSLQRNSLESPRKSGEIRRSSSLRDGRSVELDQAILRLEGIKAEFADLAEASGWWIKSKIPDSLSNNLGVDYDFEVDENRIKKRDGREVVYKDYYVLFHDLSQIVFEIQYRTEDPRQSATVTSIEVKGRPKVRVDVLHGFSSSFGLTMADFAEKTIGSKLNTGVVEEALQRLTAKSDKVLKPVGEKGFGVAVYTKSDRQVTKIDEVRPGDILCMKDAKFSNHKGLGGLTSKSITVGGGNDVYSAVVVGYDPKKDKVKVAESGKGGVVKREGYRFGDLKSGNVIAFRVVSRDTVGW